MHFNIYFLKSGRAEIISIIFSNYLPYSQLGRLKNLSNIEGFSKVVFEPNDVPEIDSFRKR